MTVPCKVLSDGVCKFRSKTKIMLERYETALAEAQIYWQKVVEDGMGV